MSWDDRGMDRPRAERIFMGNDADVRPQALILSDDLTIEGGVRTRVMDEISIIRGSFNIVLVSKVRLRNVRFIRSTRTLLRKEYPNAKVVFIPFLPHHGIPVVRESLVLLNIATMTAAGILSCIRRSPDVIYSHNLECTLSGLTLGRLFHAPVTGDFHGDEVEEDVSFNNRRRGGIRHRLWTRVQQLAVRAVDRLVCVSERQREHFRKVLGRTGDDYVIPCCVSFEEGPMSSTPRQKGASGCPVLFYAGSPFKHQMMGEMAILFNALLAEMPESAFLFLLSEEAYADQVISTFTDRSRSHLKVCTVPHERVRALAGGADVALLLREDTVFNNISSPTKFAEYLSAGLPVLITEGVGDYSGLVEKEHIGTIVDLGRIADPRYVAKAVDYLLADKEIRGRCIRYARNHLTWASYAKELMEVYAPRGGYAKKG